MKTRPNTMDAAIANEVKSYFVMFNGYKGGPIFDLGANIGAFAAECEHRYSGSLVIAVEPDKDNFDLLVNNAPNAIHINAAVAKEDGLATLYINDGENKGLHSIRNIRGRNNQIQVSTISFAKLLDEYKPEVLKIDIEDSEYLILDELICLPKCVKALAIEIHLRPQKFRIGAAPKLMESLKRQFPVHLRSTTIPPTTWATVFIGTR